MANLVLYSMDPWSYNLLYEWATSSGHIVRLLVIKLPTGAGRAGHFAGGQTLAGTDVVMVHRISDAIPMIEHVEPDLGVICSFTKVSERLGSIPRFGTVNLHCALLPAYRGPNVFRPLYEGENALGATLHRITSDYDCGAVLAQESYEIGDEADMRVILDGWRTAIIRALAEGIPKALARSQGTPQDDSAAGYAASFTPAECVVDPSLPRNLIIRRVAALMGAGCVPILEVEGARYALQGAYPSPDGIARQPGVVRQTSEFIEISTTGGCVALDLRPRDHEGALLVNSSGPRRGGGSSGPASIPSTRCPEQSPLPGSEAAESG